MKRFLTALFILSLCCTIPACSEGPGENQQVGSDLKVTEEERKSEEAMRMDMMKQQQQQQEERTGG